MFSAFFIHRPIFAAVISIVITIVGLVALGALPIARYPEIAPPTVQVTANYPGANSVVVGETVATPLEQEINGVEGMLYMTSTSSNDGNMTLTVTFQVGVDIDMATVLVQNRVSVATPKLPEEVRRQGVQVKKQSAEITVLVGVWSPDGSQTDLYLSNYATLRLKDELTRLTGVGEVMVFGAGDYGMRVWVDPFKLKARNLTTNDLVAAIREQNVQVAAGTIGAPPGATNQVFQFTVNTLGRLTTAEQFENIVVKTGTQGQLTLVKDVATVELGSKEYNIASTFNGGPCAALAIYQLPGSNAIGVSDGIKAKMEELKQAFPPGLDYVISYDSTDVIHASIAEVQETLVITLILVVLTVFVFLQSFRATLIPIVTIPVSLIGTFAVMAALGFSINQLTLFGLVLVIGIVVDDAIVVVENCTRHLDESGMSPKEAALKSMEEVSGPVIATTLVLLAVFVPTIFMGGITGRLFQQFAVTISIATVFSSINALTMSPALAAIILRPTPKTQFILFRWFNNLLGATTNVYVAITKGAIRIAAIGIFIFAGFVVLAIMGFGSLPSGFVPQEDEGWFLVNVQLPDGAALPRTQRVTDGVSAMIMETPGVTNCLVINGYSILDSSRSSNAATGFVTLENWSLRQTEEKKYATIITKLAGQMSQIQEALIMPIVPPSLPGLGVAGGFALQLQDRGGVGLTTLEQTAHSFVQTGNDNSMLDRVYTGFRANVPQLFIDIDREQVKAMGIPIQEVFDTLAAALGSAYVNDFNDFGRIYQVKVQAASEFRAEPEDIRRLEVRSKSGRMVPIASIASVREVLGPQVVTHHNIYPSAKITGSVTAGFSSGQAMASIEDMADRNLPTSMGYAWTDISYQQKAAASGIIFIFIFSVILVYLVLAAQYESWTVPLGVCLSVPTALLGAVAGALLMKMDNNVYTQIGIVLLIGLASKSSILIVEFAKTQREAGRTIVEAALDAARLRFRAVLMTAFSFILGVIPLLVASGAGAASRNALGTIVFYGMLVGTVASVVAVPMLYRVIQGTAEKFGGPPKALAPAPVQTEEE